MGQAGHHCRSDRARVTKTMSRSATLALSWCEAVARPRRRMSWLRRTLSAAVFGVGVAMPAIGRREVMDGCMIGIPRE